jgi:hypothetical protein
VPERQASWQPQPLINIQEVKHVCKDGKRAVQANTLENEVIPLLRKQHGFRDELSFFEKDRNEAYAISFWDNKADLEKYEREIYPQVHEKMAGAFVSTPTAHDFEVSNSTWYKIHAA